MSNANVELLVKGMSCQHCVKGVTRAIQQQDPQATVQVDLGSGKVQVQSVLSQAQVQAAIEEEGYDVVG